MEKPYSAKITLFRSLFDSKETAYILGVEEIYNRIKTGTGGTDVLIEKIRETKDKEERNKYKKQLKAILFAGEFSQRNDRSLDNHSGFMVTDFDEFESEDKLQEWKEKLLALDCVYMLFRSPSGNGLKAVIRIPKSTIEEHSLRHVAFEKFIDCEYFDKVNKNVSRVCFESYDPDIYLNAYAKEFTDIAKSEGYKYADKPPIIVLKNENDLINIIMNFDHGSFTEGNRNNYIFKVACCFAEYGIDRETCEGYLWNNVVHGDFDHTEFLQTVKSSYKKAEFNSKYFPDTKTIQKVKASIQKGDSAKNIIQKYGVDKEIVEDVKEQLSVEDDVFWIITHTKAGSVKVEINEWKYKEFLIKNGFAKYYPENAEKPNFVKIVENKANLIGSDQIKDFVLSFLSKKEHYEVWNFCSRATYLFTEKYLNFLDSIDLEMLKDDIKNCYIPFKNGVVNITKNEFKIIPYLDVEGYIWENQIINRNFKNITEGKTDFESFVKKVCNDDFERIKSFETTIGYLIHAHKNKSEQKAIIFNDQEIDDNPNGGSGKSLMLTALNHFRRMVKIDGKTFNPTQSDFVYQRVNVDTQIISFDDVKKNFNFEQLFSLITEGIPVNRKNKDEFYIPFERSPKVVITTNYVINGAGGSHDRRRHEVEFYQYFSSKRSPKDEYGKYFFDDWNADEWFYFDLYMIKCVMKYLERGLVEVKSINADKKRFIQNTSKEFFDWVQEGNIQINELYYTSDLLQEFIKENKELKEMSSKMFFGWIKQYADHQSYLIERGKCAQTKKRWIKLFYEQPKFL
jgi:hypothetical protein